MQASYHEISESQKAVVRLQKASEPFPSSAPVEPGIFPAVWASSGGQVDDFVLRLLKGDDEGDVGPGL